MPDESIPQLTSGFVGQVPPVVIKTTGAESPVPQHLPNISGGNTPAGNYLAGLLHDASVEVKEYLRGLTNAEPDQPGQGFIRKKIAETPLELLLPGRYVKAITELFSGEIPGDSRPAQTVAGHGEQGRIDEINAERIRERELRVVADRLVRVLVAEGAREAVERRGRSRAHLTTAAAAAAIAAALSPQAIDALLAAFPPDP